MSITARDLSIVTSGVSVSSPRISLASLDAASAISSGTYAARLTSNRTSVASIFSVLVAIGHLLLGYFCAWACSSSFDTSNSPFAPDGRSMMLMLSTSFWMAWYWMSCGVSDAFSRWLASAWP